MVTIWHKTLYW